MVFEGVFGVLTHVRVFSCQLILALDALVALNVDFMDVYGFFLGLFIKTHIFYDSGSKVL